MTSPRTPDHCPSCFITLPLSGEANCDCDGGYVPQRPAPVPAEAHPPTPMAGPLHGPALPPAELAPARSRTTAERLRELPDLAAHLALRLTTARPNTDPVGSKGDPAETAPANLAILHALDDRPRHSGDMAVDYAEDEAWQCPHKTHRKDDCPWEADDDGRQGLLPDLDLWARMIAGDLEAYDPQLPGNLPDPATITTICAWLLEHHPRWEQLTDGPAGRLLSDTTRHQLLRGQQEMAKDVRRWHNRLRSELGERDPITLRHATAGGCGNVIEPRDGGTWYACTGCGQVFDHHAGLKRLAELQAPPTLAEAAELTGIPLVTLKRRVASRDLLPVNPGVRPARFRLRDVSRLRWRVEGGALA